MILTQLDINEINLFLSESNRQREEKFLRGITDNYKNKLIFSSNTCTNGNLVEVNPNHPFIHNLEAVKKVLEDLKLEIDLNTWLLLKVFTRGSIAHEAFHILFTDFRTLERMNEEFKEQHPYKRKIMHNIMNILEDSFIELAGINYLQGLQFYIEFGNELAYQNALSLEDIEAKCKAQQRPWINLFLHWAMMYAIVGKTKGKIKNRRINSYIKKAMPYFDKGRIEKDSNKRYEYAKQIYDIVADLIEEAIENDNTINFDYFKNENIPHLEEVINPDVEIKRDFNGRNSQLKQKDNTNEKDKSRQDKNKQDNHDNNTENNHQEEKNNKQRGNNNKENKSDNKENCNRNNQRNDEKEKSQEKDEQQGRNYSGKDDSENPLSNTQKTNESTDNSSNDDIIDSNYDPNEDEENVKKKQEELDKLIKELQQEKQKVEKDEKDRQKIEEREKEEEKKIQNELSKVRYSILHKDISIGVNKKFEPLLYSETIYNNIISQYQGLIQKFYNMLNRLIKNQNESWQNKQLIGSELDTKRLYDPKGRVWKRKNDHKEVADLCIQLLIDGSGSMSNKISQVVVATVIIYEVARRLGIPICIVEERAIYGHPRVVHNVLVDYRNYKNPNIKYNILRLRASGGTREGVSLKWVSAYQDLQPHKDKLIIVLADGNPEHSYSGNSYTGYIAIRDTKAVAEEIERRGTKIVAISLGEDCYPSLQKIYSKVILCDNLSHLPNQMIRILKQHMFK